MRMHSADYAVATCGGQTNRRTDILPVARCLSVCLSVRHTPEFCRKG